MPKIETIICDNKMCAKEITESSNGILYRLKLSAEKRLYSSAESRMEVMSLHIPPISGDKYFCHSRCLVEWVNTGNP